MSQKRILRYIILIDGYSRRTVSGWRNFERAKTFKAAKRHARRMGVGAVIERLVVTRSGKYKRSQLVYRGEQ